MKVQNLFTEPLGVVHSWLPKDLRAREVVFFPDACPGKSLLPTGTVVHLSDPDWRKFAVSDCGCGMRLLRSDLSPDDLNLSRWDSVADQLRLNKGGLGYLGGGNHFLDALVPYEGGPMYFLIHTGSRLESGHVDQWVDEPTRFDREFARVVAWAADNRAAVQDALEKTFGQLDLVMDHAHNTFEPQEDGSVIIGKGAVNVFPGDLLILPSHMMDDVLLTWGIFDWRV